MALRGALGTFNPEIVVSQRDKGGRNGVHSRYRDSALPGNRGAPFGDDGDGVLFCSLGIDARALN